MTQSLQYPVGKFAAPTEFDQNQLREWIRDIENFPALLSKEVTALSEDDMDTPYRPGGWSVRQVVHHCADSHMNSFIRYKLALTEDNPRIKAYFEDRWAEMSDYLGLPVESSLQILEGLHFRWVSLLKAMTEADFGRTFFHPEKNRSITLYETTALYSWHCRHHLGHVKLVAKQA